MLEEHRGDRRKRRTSVPPNCTGGTTLVQRACDAHTHLIDLDCSDAWPATTSAAGTRPITTCNAESASVNSGALDAPANARDRVRDC